MRRVDADEKSGRNATTLLPSEREGSGVYALDPSSSKSEPLLLDPRGNGGNGKNGSGGGAGSALGAFASGSSRRDNGKAVTTILVLGYMLCSGILNTPQVISSFLLARSTLTTLITLMWHLLSLHLKHRQRYFSSINDVGLLASWSKDFRYDVRWVKMGVRISSCQNVGLK